MNEADSLNESIRAEDVFLGAMGFAEDAILELLQISGQEVYLVGSFKSDGQKFRLLYDCEIGDLEAWALDVLKKQGRVVEIEKHSP